VIRFQKNVPLPRFVVSLSFVGQFDAVVDGVSDHVHHGFINLFDHIPVDLGVLAGHHELDVLTGFFSQVSHEPQHLLEGMFDRHHPERHGRVLQPGCEQVQLVGYLTELSVVTGFNQIVLTQHGLGNGQFTDHVNDVVELPGVHFYMEDCGPLDLLLFPQNTDDFPRLGLVLLDKNLAQLFPFILILGDKGVFDVFLGYGTLFHQHLAQGLFPFLSPGSIRLDPLHQFRSIRLALVGGTGLHGSLHMLDHAFEHIDAVQDDVHNFIIDGQFFVAGLVQQIFRGMGQFVDLVEIEKPGDTLDRVERSEDRIDDLHVRRLLLEVHQFYFDGSQVFQRFGHKIIDDLLVLFAQVNCRFSLFSLFFIEYFRIGCSFCSRMVRRFAIPGFFFCGHFG